MWRTTSLIMKTQSWRPRMMALTSAQAKLQKRYDACSYHYVSPTSYPYIQDSGAEDLDDGSDEDEDEDEAAPPPQMDVDPQAVKPSMHVPGPNSTRPPHQGRPPMSPNLPNELIGMWSGRTTFISSPSQTLFITYPATQKGVVDIGEWVPATALLCC